jgi:hypothetical protein
MVPGDERYERLKHQSLFLRARGLTPPEMEAWHRHLSLLERLAGKDPGTFDPRLVDRLHSQLEKAAMEQLKATGLVDDWLVSWERRSEIASAHALVPTEENPAQPIDGKSIVNVDGNHTLRSLEDKLAKLEQAVQLFSESVASARKADEQPTSP